jgi:UDP-N-acetylglucosamine 3-dehydrogenase
MTPTTLRAAVIGVGAMGQHHVRAYSEIPDIELVACADLSESLRSSIEKRFQVECYSDYRDLLDHTKPDLITVAVPTTEHLAVAKYAIERGIHVLVEKPLAENEADAQMMIDLARQHQVVLAVGHIERHNPAIQLLKTYLDQNRIGKIFEMQAFRVGPFPTRIRDVGVVFDLATHDIDILRYLAGTSIERVFAETQQNIHSMQEDTLNGLLRFTNGIIGVLRVNWVTPTKNRRLLVVGEGGMIEVDYITQDLTVYENGDMIKDFPILQLSRGVSEGRVIREKVSKQEPLRVELNDFISAIRNQHLPRVTGEDSLKAMQVAIALIQSGNTHQAISTDI